MNYKIVLIHRHGNSLIDEEMLKQDVIRFLFILCCITQTSVCYTRWRITSGKFLSLEELLQTGILKNTRSTSCYFISSPLNFYARLVAFIRISQKVESIQIYIVFSFALTKQLMNIIYLLRFPKIIIFI